MGPEGTPRRTIRLYYVRDNEDIDVYKIVFAWPSEDLILTNKKVQVLNNCKLYYYRISSPRPNAAEEIRALYFNGEKSTAKVFRVDPKVKTFATIEEARAPTIKHLDNAEREPHRQAIYDQRKNGMVCLKRESNHYILEIRKVEDAFGSFFTAGLDFPSQPVPINLYYLGLWLVDGKRNDTLIYNNNEREIVGYLSKYVASLGMFLKKDPKNLFYSIRGTRYDEDGYTRSTGIRTDIPGFNVPFIEKGSKPTENKLLQELRNLRGKQARI